MQRRREEPFRASRSQESGGRLIRGNRFWRARQVLDSGHEKNQITGSVRTNPLRRVASVALLFLWALGLMGANGPSGSLEARFGVVRCGLAGLPGIECVGFEPASLTQRWLASHVTRQEQPKLNTSCLTWDLSTPAPMAAFGPMAI